MSLLAGGPLVSLLPRRMRSLSLPQLLLLSVVVGSCGGDSTAPQPGTLTVEIDGLPAGALPDVTIEGPGGYTGALVTSRTIEGLTPGTYTITAAAVTRAGSRFLASPASQTVDVSGRAAATAEPIEYGIATARLTIEVLGLSEGAASVTVTGPMGFTRTVTATTALDLLTPGEYTIAAATVTVNGTTFRAAPSPITLQLPASTTPRLATVAYGAGDGFLDLVVDGLPATTAAAITVTGPSGYTRTVTSAMRLHFLEPGTYTVASGIAGSNLTTHRPIVASQSIPVVEGDTAAVTVAYASEPLQLALETVVEGLANPVFLTAPKGDPRLFVVERSGRVRIIEDGALLPAPFVDLSARVNSIAERGLLGMAFDPRYEENGWFYVYYVAHNGDMVLERIGSTPGADVASGEARVVMTLLHGGENHHGGMIAFGPDEMLYLAPGDGGCCGDPQDRGQNLGTPLGKLLRIDVRTLPYTIPPDNPFVHRTGARPEIWAYGLRNPWRFAFDPTAGLLYIGDVGENSREEVNVSPITSRGLNYGWRLMEGRGCHIPSTNCDPGGLTLPAIEYLHTSGCSVTGGFVYRGSAIPELTGHYLYSDFCAGWLRSFRGTSGGALDVRSWEAISLPFTVSFGEDGAGELYMIAGARISRIVRP